MWTSRFLLNLNRLGESLQRLPPAPEIKNFLMPRYYDRRCREPAPAESPDCRGSRTLSFRTEIT